MINKIRCLLTAQEQKALLFLLIMAVAGMSSLAFSRQEQNPSGIRADTLTVKESYPLLDIRRANTRQLATIPGIGPSRAAAIVAYRQKHGFTKTSDLILVKGIGPKIMESVKPWLVDFGPKVEPAQPSDSLVTAYKPKEVFPKKPLANLKVSINKCTANQLMGVKGIGPVKAKAVLAYRAELGGFSSWDQVLSIKGIGNKTLDLLKAKFYLREQ